MQCNESDGTHIREEFIPLNGRSDDDGVAKMGKDSSDKRSWMSSAQLWSCNGSSDDTNKKSVLEFKQVNFWKIFERGITICWVFIYIFYF